MKIIDHRLCKNDGTPYSYQESPNIGQAIEPKYLLMHYTVSSSVDSTINILMNKNVKASAHLVIGREGDVIQLVPFNRAAWHAGKSYWKGLEGLNSYSIGIAMVNWGYLHQTADSKWRTKYNHAINPEEVVEAVHKHETQSKGWQTYTFEQLEVLEEIAQVLVAEYNLEDILGQEDVSSILKFDPGPAFPMDNFRARLFGQWYEKEQAEIHETTVPLNIRIGPGVQYDKLEGSPLPEGTRLEIKDAQGNWCEVEVLDLVNGIKDLEGWVCGKFVKTVG